ncbi:Uncharacterised protein [uncultured archaeon]|nr:Uncharacterised protein [uncultured archaeon]
MGLNRMLNEPEIYVRCKEILRKNGWMLLGGEPPDGTDDIPRIELRDPSNQGIGSKGSRKVDLIGYKQNKILLLELKDHFSAADVSKLDSIVSEERWRQALKGALDGKRAFKKAGLEERLSDLALDPEALVKALGLPEAHAIKDDFVLIVVKPEGYELAFGKLCGTDKDFFESG